MAFFVIIYYLNLLSYSFQLLKLVILCRAADLGLFGKSTTVSLKTEHQNRGYTCNALLQCKFVKQSNIYIVLQILFLLHRLGDIVLAAFMLFSCS